jgi:LmbE family N-acetylglucosaminyl deacetylase
LRVTRRATTWLAAFLASLLLLTPAQSQAPSPQITPQLQYTRADQLAYSGPTLAQDTGITALYEDLLKLRTTARLMHTAAHPDDEDGGMLTVEGRGLGATTLLMTINRGEGGQNKFGNELFDELGILRTLELLAADKYYGTQERFTHAVDFGFSKNEEETFQKWGGHDPALADMVRVIRIFRPDVLITRFQGSPHDGHGNHQASGTLTKEAFKAAADPNRFPEQIREGLQPFQARKLYMDGFSPDENWTLRLNTGVYNPWLGMSFAQFGLEGLAHQISQGAGGARIPPGDRFTRYKLIGSVLPQGTNVQQESNYFDGIDISAPGMLHKLGINEARVPNVASALKEMDRDAAQAMQAFDPADPTKCAPPLMAGIAAVNSAIAAAQRADLPAGQAQDLLANLNTKLDQFNRAAGEALGVTLIVAVDPPGTNPSNPFGFPRYEQTFLFAVPGQTFTITARLYNRGKQTVVADDIQLHVAPSWRPEVIEKDLGKPLAANQSAFVRFRVTVPVDAQYTRPYWHRNDPQTESVYQIDDPQYATLPFVPPPVSAMATYNVSAAQAAAHNATISSPVLVRYVDPIYGQQSRPLAVAPAVSVELQPATQVINTALTKPADVRVEVRNDSNSEVKGTVRLEVPAGWRVTPASQPVSLAAENEIGSYSFSVTSANLREQHYKVRAIVDAGDRHYEEGFRTITRQDIGAYFFYRPSRQDVSAVDVKLPEHLRVGYIMGAGDDIPPVLTQLGLDVHMITPAELASGNLSQYDTILVGIRAYDVRTDIRQYNRRLLDFVQQGGTLVVQYNQNASAFNAGHYTPYPATLSNERVSVEEAPVEVLDAQSPILRTPNAISQRDFGAWVQERGLYFMSDWDSHFTPLLSSHDPGEEPLKGGLLVAKYGKGTYIYTGYAFFRQLPAGVPGATRLFVNLLAAKGGL